MAVSDERDGDVICAELLRATTALQAAVFARMDGKADAAESIRDAAGRIATLVRGFGRCATTGQG